MHDPTDAKPPLDKSSGCKEDRCFYVSQLSLNSTASLLSNISQQVQFHKGKMLFCTPLLSHDLKTFVVKMDAHPWRG